MKSRLRFQNRINSKIDTNPNKEVSHQEYKDDIGTQSISEYWFSWLLLGLIPPAVCISQYFVTAVFVFGLLLEGFDWTLTVAAIFILVIALIMLPFWYKTLFYKDYVGADRPLLVQWSNDWIRFRSLFLDIRIEATDIA